MTHDEAIKDLMECCDEYEKIISQLQEENAFLTETIENNNLDKIASERRTLLNNIKQRESASELKMKNAESIKTEYFSKLDELNERLADIKTKQDNINLYIDASAEEKVANERQEYQKHKSVNDKALKKHMAECDKHLQEKIILYKEKQKKCIIITICSVLLGIIGILINFM